MPVVQRQDKVEEVGLAQVGGRLFLEVGPGESDPAGEAERKRRSASGSQPRQLNRVKKRFLVCIFIKTYIYLGGGWDKTKKYEA